MSLSLSLRERLLLPAILAFPFFVSGQPVVSPQENEYAIPKPLAGDQIHSHLSLDQGGGYLVWEENGSAKTGSQIKAIRLNSSLTPISDITVNKVVKGDQANPKVQLLNNGDVLFIWQSYGLGNADIFARLLKEDGSFAKGDIRVNSVTKPKGSYSKDQQSAPAVCALQGGGAFVAWQSFGQDGSMFGIYATRITADGLVAPIGRPDTTVGKKKVAEPNEFLVNQTTAYNQRSPAVATLANGNVVVVWVSEQQRFPGSVDVYARLFTPAGSAISGELLLNSPNLDSANNICGNPSVVALANGGFTVVWSEKDLTSDLSKSNSWDVVGRSFLPEGAATGADFKINTHTYGEQFDPEIASVGSDCVVVWTSLGQDGSREGVYGRVLRAGVQPYGDEFRVNATTVSRQRFPSVASAGEGRFLVTWSSFVAGTSFDLFGREYVLNPQP